MLRNVDYYHGMLDALELEPGTIERYDAEEAGVQYGGGTEYEDSHGAFGFSALDRDEQVALLMALDKFLVKTSRTNYRTPSSYGMKHIAEDYLGRYTSNLQLKTAMRLLGFKRGRYDNLNPHYNVSKRSVDIFRFCADYAERMRWRRRHP